MFLIAELLVEESTNLSSKSEALESKLEDEAKQWDEQQQQAELATDKTLAWQANA